MKKRYVLSYKCLPQSAFPLNTLMWWVLSIKVFEISLPWEIFGWILLAALVAAKVVAGMHETEVDMFEDYAARQTAKEET